MISPNESTFCFSNGNLAVIPEIYDGDHSKDTFSLKLEKYLEAGYETIVIEPFALGDETSRWIKVGNFLHKTAVITGICTVLSGTKWKLELKLL